MLTQEQIYKYRALPNPPQSLYNALRKQIRLKKSPARCFAVPEGGYIAYVCYFYFLKMLEYTDEQVMDEGGFSSTIIERIQKILDNIIRGGEDYDRTNTRFQLIANYMIHEQMGYPHEDKTNV